jgi:hypothetical protein
LWKGRRAEAEELIGHLPPHIRKNTDFFAAFLSKTDAETLRDKRQGQRFRL